MRRSALSALALLLFAQSAILSAPTEPLQSAAAPLPVFEFHSGFWINLHHFLYQQARQRRDAKDSKSAVPPAPAAAELSPAERAAWEAAVRYYSANFADTDLAFNSDLGAVKDKLSDLETCAELSGKTTKDCDAEFPPALTRALEAAAPVYRAHWWPQHDRDNRRWIAQVAPIVRQNGVGLAQRLAEIYQAKWPREKIRVDICAYANWAGAYTTLDPLRVTISSEDPRNQSLAALEILFHEASHGLAGPVELAILRECRQLGKPIPRDLWHALLFYTTGEVIKQLIQPLPASASDAKAATGATASSSSPGLPSGPNSTAYVPYAVREGLYKRGWTGYQRALEQFWQPYLDGRESFDDAIARIVSAL